MNAKFLRPVSTIVAAVAVAVVLSPRADAARNSGALERIVARAVDVGDPTQATKPIDILIERWSTPEELDTLRGTMVRSPEMLLLALQNTWRPAGVLLSPGIMSAGARGLERRAQNLQFAREAITAAGRQVVFATDQHLWLGEKGGRRLEGHEFMLVDVRFGPDGQGVGKVAAADNVVYNAHTKLLEVKNYTAAPTRLVEVRSEKP
jgi:hypothetical protein